MLSGCRENNPDYPSLTDGRIYNIYFSEALKNATICFLLPAKAPDHPAETAKAQDRAENRQKHNRQKHNTGGIPR